MTLLLPPHHAIRGIRVNLDIPHQPHLGPAERAAFHAPQPAEHVGSAPAAERGSRDRRTMPAGAPDVDDELPHAGTMGERERVGKGWRCGL